MIPSPTASDIKPCREATKETMGVSISHAHSQNWPSHLPVTTLLLLPLLILNILAFS